MTLLTIMICRLVAERREGDESKPEHFNNRSQEKILWVPGVKYQI